MKLYHEVHGCSMAVDIVARELQIPLELEWVNTTARLTSDGSDYLKINSKGAVPALELPDGQHLTEGAVIMQYLADLRPGNALLAPAGTLELYRILEWMSFIGADLHKGGFMPLFKRTTPPAYREIAIQNVQARLQWINDQLADRAFLTGSTFTIADAHCYAIVIWTRRHAIDTAAWPHLEAWLARVQSRPSVQAAERDEQAETRARAAREAAAAVPSPQ